MDIEIEEFVVEEMALKVSKDEKLASLSVLIFTAAPSVGPSSASVRYIMKRASRLNRCSGRSVNSTRRVARERGHVAS